MITTDPLLLDILIRDRRNEITRAMTRRRARPTERRRLLMRRLRQRSGPDRRLRLRLWWARHTDIEAGQIEVA